MSLRAAILGFLELEPASGYTLQQRFDGSVSGFWTATQSQVYRELHALERDGLVSRRVEPGDGKPARKIYSVTPTGRDALEMWLREPLEPFQLRHPLLLKLVFSTDLEPDALDALLGSYESGLDVLREEYAARAGSPEIFELARSPREAQLWELAIDHGVAWVDMERAWVRRARARLREPVGARPTRGKRKAARVARPTRKRARAKATKTTKATKATKTSGTARTARTRGMRKKQR
jgi:DNA-binding PadR family transcriptional regulator